jgi:3-methyladenine DNA glycosylase AlkD
MGMSKEILALIIDELPPLGNRARAAGARSYMKDIAPFLGVDTPTRRKTIKRIAKSFSGLTSDELGKTVRALWRLDHREFQYAGNDLIAIFLEAADKHFLEDHVEFLLTHKSWWDTVDGLGSVAISPLTLKYNSLKLMKKWNRSENIWLNRAAIQHQRGRRYETDIPLLLSFCHDHADDPRFWNAKAIGWALRDLARIDRKSVDAFLREHPNLNSVAVREANKHKAR